VSLGGLQVEDMVERWAIIWVSIAVSVSLVTWQYIVGKSSVARTAAGKNDEQSVIAEIVYGLLHPAVSAIARVVNVPLFCRRFLELARTCLWGLLAPTSQNASEDVQSSTYLSPYETSKRMFGLFVVIFLAITLANKMELIRVGVPAHYQTIGESRIVTETVALGAELLSLVRYLGGLILFIGIGMTLKALGVFRLAKSQALSAHLVYEYNAVFFVLTGVSAFFLLFLSGFDGTERPIRAQLSVAIAFFLWIHFGWCFHRLRVLYNGSAFIGTVGVLLASFIACVIVYVIWLLGIVVFTLAK